MIIQPMLSCIIIVVYQDDIMLNNSLIVKGDNIGIGQAEF